MKIVFLGISIVVGIGLSACATHNDNFYNRANNASEKSLQGLDKDTK